jgi:hypothetical protein
MKTVMRQLKRMLRALVDAPLKPFGFTIVNKRAFDLFYQHDYGEGGYERYRASQIATNKRKFDKVFADEKTLTVVADDVKVKGITGPGICHGARNGWEIERLREMLGAEVIGTDISETAATVPNMVVHDFHDHNPDWVGKFGFVYSNSLDQAFDPKKALLAWTEQLAPGGAIYIEHTMQHSAAGAGEMDPFGAHAMLMPYLFFEWGKGVFQMTDMLQLKAKAKDVDVWVFVLQAAD